MSWQTYVDSNLVGSGKVSRAAIIGLKGGIWAASPNYTLSTQEQKEIIATFTDPSHAQANGIMLAGEKFFTLRADDKVILLKKKSDGAVLAKTNLAVLVAEYVAPTQAPETATEVEKVADYLRNAGS